MESNYYKRWQEELDNAPFIESESSPIVSESYVIPSSKSESQHFGSLKGHYKSPDWDGIIKEWTTWSDKTCELVSQQFQNGSEA